MILYEQVILDGQYQLKNLLRTNRHANVYQVWSIPRNSPVEELEARVYIDEDIPDKLRHYRLRSIKRLSSRTVLEVRNYGLIIVLYKVDSKSVEGSKNGMHSEPTPRNDERVEKMQNAKTKQKSDHQRETARLRQLERRRLNRQKKQDRKTESSLGDSKGLAQGVQEREYKEETLHSQAHLAYSHGIEVYQQPPLIHRVNIEKYNPSQPLNFENDDDMESSWRLSFVKFCF